MLKEMGEIYNDFYTNTIENQIKKPRDRRVVLYSAKWKLLKRSQKIKVFFTILLTDIFVLF